MTYFTLFGYKMTFPTIDEESSWQDDIVPEYLAEAEQKLNELRRALNKLHNYEHKQFTVGLTMGIEAYIVMLKKGKS
jgi:hypothetical protein